QTCALPIYEVLREAYPSRPGERFRLVITHPHHLLDRIGGVQAVHEGGVGDLLSEELDELLGLCGGTGVGPDDGWSYRLMALVEKHRPHQPPADGHAADSGGGCPAVMQERGRGVEDRVGPGVGILLGGAAVVEMDRIADGDRAEQAP